MISLDLFLWGEIKSIVYDTPIDSEDVWYIYIYFFKIQENMHIVMGEKIFE